MAKPARGLPSGFSLDLPDDGPVVIGDFLDEVPVPIQTRQPKRETPILSINANDEAPLEVAKSKSTISEQRARATRPSVIRCQLNLTPKSKSM